MDVFDGFEPGHARIVNMVRLVVEHHQFVDVAHDHAQVDFGVGGRAGGPLAQEIIHRVFVVGRSGNVVPGIDAVDVGQEDVAGRAGDAHLVLYVQGQLKIVAPVAPVDAVVGQDRIVFQKDAQALKIFVDAVQHDDVGGDHQEVARKRRIRLVEFVVEAPGQHQAQHLGLAGAGRHFHHEAPPGLVKHAGGDRAGTVEAHQVVLVLHAHHVVEIDDGLQRLALGKVILELGHRAIGLGQQVRGIEPPVEQTAAGVCRADIAAVPPFLHFLAQLRHQRRHQLVRSWTPAGLHRPGTSGWPGREWRRAIQGSWDGVPLFLPSHVDFDDRHGVVAEDVDHLDGELAPPRGAFMKDAGQFQRAVFLGAEGLPLVFKDVIPGPASLPTRRLSSFFTRTISRLLSKLKSTAQ